MAISQKKIHSSYDTINFPKELSNFLNRNNYVLLIKGASGTGKTTLALSILLSLQLKKKGLFISTRVSIQKLFEYFIWLKKFGQLPEKLTTQEDSEFVTDLATFIDGRLYEPGTLFERISNELMDFREPLIIIDSLDAVEFFPNKETTMNNAKVLQSWCERVGAKLIITVEDTNYSTFDFISDGIVELREKLFAGTKIRSIILSKLRGIKIERPSYVFTLNRSMFRSFNTYNPIDFDINFSPKIFPDYKAKNLLVNPYFSSGYWELDKALGGGFHQKKIIDIILESSLSNRIIIGFLNKIILDFVMTKNLILFQGFNKEDSNFLENNLVSVFPQAIRTGLIKVVLPIDLPNKEIIQTDLNEKKQIENEYFQLVQKNILVMKKKYPEKKLINIMGFIISDRFYNTDDNNYINKSLIEFIKLNTDISFLISKHLGIEKQISDKSDMALRFFLKDDYLYLQSIKPWSQLFTVVISKNDENGYLHLEQIA